MIILKFKYWRDFSGRVEKDCGQTDCVWQLSPKPTQNRLLNDVFTIPAITVIVGKGQN